MLADNMEKARFSLRVKLLAITIPSQAPMVCRLAHRNSVMQCFSWTTASLEYLNKSNGWEIGVGPSIVVVDAGMAKTLTTSTAQEGIYAFIFSQKGLMAGLGLQGSKISRINP